MKISDQQLLEVIKNTPLVSIDIILKNNEGEILLGLRNNEPAKDTWFVPGGRIRKDEDLDSAFERIANDELGLNYTRDQARFVGIFENKYDTNFLKVPDVGTHYIILAYEIKPSKIPMNFPTNQHQNYRWFTRSEAIKNSKVNTYVYPYFENQNLTDAQYRVLNARRDSFNQLVWRTPVLSLTAQAFLFTIALNPLVSPIARTMSASLAFITAIASAQLLLKHRFNEREHAVILEEFERQRGINPINQKITPDSTLKESKCTWDYLRTWIEGIPSYKIWFVLLLIFALFALIILIFPTKFV
jgi:colanic acid biosynthesis protein WcaH